MSIDPQLYRETLGHYPTGVALVTAIAEDGQPHGMIVGSFTSLSMDPPLVTFMPMRSSYTYTRIQSAKSFCVNVLAADQLDTCRQFASKAEHKFAGVEWEPTPSGAPRLKGAVSWIDCTFENELDGGDHVIVVGRITDLGVQRAVLPLLFFQGGYGRFSPVFLLSANAGLVTAALSSERMRDTFTDLARRLKVDVSILAESGRFAAYVATANESDPDPRVGRRRRTASVGMQFPLIPPLGAVFRTDSSDDKVEEWLSRARGADSETRARMLRSLDRVRERGFSLSLRQDAETEAELGRGAREWGEGDITPSRMRELLRLQSQALDHYEPDLVDDEDYDVRAIVVPVPVPAGHVPLAIRMANPTDSVSGATVKQWGEELKACARDIATRLCEVAQDENNGGNE